MMISSLMLFISCNKLLMVRFRKNPNLLINIEQGTSMKRSNVEILFKNILGKFLYYNIYCFKIVGILDFQYSIILFSSYSHLLFFLEVVSNQKEFTLEITLFNKSPITHFLFIIADVVLFYYLIILSFELLFSLQLYQL